MAVVNSSSRIIQTLIRPTSKKTNVKNQCDIALTTGGTCPLKVMETKQLNNLKDRKYFLISLLWYNCRGQYQFLKRLSPFLSL